MFELFLVFLLCHYAADFLFQTDRAIQLKKVQLHKGLLRHTTCHLVVTLIGAIVYGIMTRQLSLIPDLVLAAILVTAAHYLIDWAKERVNRRFNRTLTSAVLFLFDQLLHLFAIVLSLNYFGLIAYTFTQFKADVLTFLFKSTSFSEPSQLLMLTIIMILATQGAGYFLGIVLRDLSATPSLDQGTYSIADEQMEIKTTYNETGQASSEITKTKTEQFLKDSPQKIGRYIGMIERLLIMIFIVQGTPHGLTFLIAVKSVTRFKQFENKRFAEYYLIGSLLSALIAVILGYIVMRVL